MNSIVSFTAGLLRGFERTLFAATLAGAGLLFSGSAGAVFNGTYTISSSGTHNLPEDVSGMVRINASNVTLDCNNKSITYSGYSAANCSIYGVGSRKCGILVSNRSGVTIRNCHVSGGFYSGIYVKDGSHVKIEYSTASGAYLAGVRADNTSWFSMYSFDAVSNHIGVHTEDLSDGEIAYTYANLNSDGFYINGGLTIMRDNTHAFYNETGFKLYEGTPIPGPYWPEMWPEVVAHTNEYEGIVTSNTSFNMRRTHVYDNNAVEYPASAGVRLVNTEHSTIQDSVFENNNLCDLKIESSSSFIHGNGNSVGVVCERPFPCE